jgi:transposase-like protein
MSSNYQEGRPSIYDKDFKIAVAREYLSSKLGYGKLAKKHQLPGADTVRFFVKWYKKNYPDTHLPSPADAAVAPVGSSSNEIAELRKQLQLANLKVAGWEMLLENARKELGTDIVKKYGTKQPDK